jgi:tRNA(fMet)-specific endonuclease VapC
MKYMLDTNILIYLIKRRPVSVAARINRLNVDDDVCMSYVTYAELLKGAERSERKIQTLDNLDKLTRQIPVMYSVGKELCEHYAQQFTRLKSLGRPIGGNDLWIACHALAEKATLVTNNISEFERVSGLAIENWAQSVE